MSPCRRVAEDIWLGFARPAPSGYIAVSQRLERDRRAGRAALEEVLAASGLRRDEAATSTSHTQGAGVVLLAPIHVRLGIDIVAIDRLNNRHAEALLKDDEWSVLASHDPHIRPALAWALKEAAAKAIGEPLRCFPDGLLIQEGPEGLVVCQPARPGLGFFASWTVFGGFLCAWVQDETPDTEWYRGLC